MHVASEVAFGVLAEIMIENTTRKCKMECNVFHELLGLDGLQFFGFQASQKLSPFYAAHELHGVINLVPIWRDLLVELFPMMCKAYIFLERETHHVKCSLLSAL